MENGIPFLIILLLFIEISVILCFVLELTLHKKGGLFDRHYKSKAYYTISFVVIPIFLSLSVLLYEWQAELMQEAEIPKKVYLQYLFIALIFVALLRLVFSIKRESDCSSDIDKKYSENLIDEWHELKR